ncbi:hypothetical protein SAMN06265222_112113 [Neorhodopirellula lusitana]|uniref:DUF8091 domain-containing protein n=1 Tax=Neorhodopirellula lusitana TaxID=445327 RepID=A0ABY1QJ43_9BACT|nr:hypothetical protein [Neorhodopirellula lusitana]SMP69847.1 hypothetical protein SAMN06265222_112113 [Neorhodopirellula lusitana]
METSLHQQLKLHYATSPDQIEVTMGAYRIDVIRDDELIEIQCASLSAIRKKILDLLRRHPVRIVKPAIHRTRICKRQIQGGPTTSRRLSPKRGQPHELFEELIYLRGVFPHDNLVLEVPIVDVNQYRWMRKRKSRRRRDPGYVIEDVELDQVHRSIELTTPQDLWKLLPDEQIPESLRDAESINTLDLAEAINCPRWIAQRIVYVMRHCNALTPTGRDKTGIHYKVA